MKNIRTRNSFEIMRSVLVAVRGVRGKIRQAKADPIASIAFNPSLKPDVMSVLKQITRCFYGQSKISRFSNRR